MSDAETLRLVYSPHAAKRIAAAFGVAVITAKVWLSGGVPASRRRELAAALLAELDRQDAERAEIRRRLREIADGESGDTESGEGSRARARARARMDLPKAN